MGRFDLEARIGWDEEGRAACTDEPEGVGGGVRGGYRVRREDGVLGLHLDGPRTWETWKG